MKWFWHSTLMNNVARMVVRLDNYLWRKRATPQELSGICSLNR